MGKWKKLVLVVYQCSYHIVWYPKYRYKILKGQVGKFVENRIKTLCEMKKVEILELNEMEDHIHMVATIPPKVSVSELMGILKGETAISLFKSYIALKKKPHWGNHFWSREYCISTVGLDEEKIRRYVKYQEENERLEESQQKDYYRIIFLIANANSILRVNSNGRIRTKPASPEIRCPSDSSAWGSRNIYAGAG